MRTVDRRLEPAVWHFLRRSYARLLAKLSGTDLATLSGQRISELVQPHLDLLRHDHMLFCELLKQCSTLTMEHMNALLRTRSNHASEDEFENGDLLMEALEFAQQKEGEG